MVLPSNVTIDDYLSNKISANTLNPSEHILIALAVFMANLYPSVETFVGAQQQEVNPPALFVDYYSLTHNQRLIDTSQHDFGIEITYVPSDRLSRAELNSAIYTIQQNLYKIPSGIGEIVCYNKSSDITDGLAHVTGIVSIRDIEIPTGEIIQIADKELVK